MPSFSKKSLAQLQTCDSRLQKIARRAIEVMDFSIVEGHRDKEHQDIAVAKGLSKVNWPDGKHNKNPSLAMDCAPYPIDWTDSEKARQRFCLLAGVMLMAAAAEGFKIRWGGDWDSDRDTRDEKFRDLPHFELIEP